MVEPELDFWGFQKEKMVMAKNFGCPLAEGKCESINLKSQ